MELLGIRETAGVIAPVRLVGTVRYDDGTTEEYWFEGPERLNRSGTPWLATLLPLAVATGENIRISLPTDPEFLRNASGLMRLWSSWYPWARIVEVDAPAVAHAEPSAFGRTVAPPTTAGQLSPTPSSTATFFSGGVDSWFTALRRPDATSWIVCLGFDMPVFNTEAFRHHCDRLKATADECGRELIVCATNIRQTRWQTAPWELLAFGPALGMVALFLSERFTRVYVPSSFDTARLRPWGSHPVVFFVPGAAGARRCCGNTV